LLSETQTYGYDAQDRLTEVCYQSSCPGGSDPFIRWTYDDVGNRLSEARPSGTTNYTYNAADQLTQAGSTSFDYDENGNEIEAGSTSYTYDLANRLLTVDDGTTTTTYAYDGDGSRLEADDGTSVVRYLWDTNFGLPQLALERTGGGSLIRRYLYGQGRISMSSGGNSFYYHRDALGSIAQLTDAAGDSQWTYGYEPYGAIKTETEDETGAPENPIRFAGELFDQTGLYQLRARQYDPTLGRFTRPDPASCAHGAPSISGYAYADDRPTLRVDPSGETSLPCDGGQAAAQASSYASGGEEAEPPRNQFASCTAFVSTRSLASAGSRNCVRPLRGASLRNARRIWTLALAAGISEQRAREMIAAACQEGLLEANTVNASSGAAGLFQLLGPYVTRANQLGGVSDPRANTCAILWNYKAYWDLNPVAPGGLGAKVVEQSGAPVSFYAAPLATLRRSFTRIAVKPCPRQKPICASYFGGTRFASPNCSVNG